MANPFQKVKKEKVWTKIMLAGPSGSGKTYSALRLAAGLSEACGSRFAVIDTEAGRVKYYADEFDFDGMELDTYEPESYISAIQAALDGGYQVIVIDSGSHEWTYCCDTVNKMPGNSFTNWGKMTPRHDRFMEKILQSPAHIICTVRGKDEYTLEEKNGKQTPRKVGLGYKQRDNTEYDYTITFNIDQSTHVASAMKDNTHIFENKFNVLTEKDGKAIYEWANSGTAPVPKPAEKPLQSSADDSLDEVRQQISGKVSELVNSGTAKEDIGKCIKNIASTANYNKVDDADVLNQVLQALDKWEGPHEIKQFCNFARAHDS